MPKERTNSGKTLEDFEGEIQLLQLQVALLQAQVARTPYYPAPAPWPAYSPYYPGRYEIWCGTDTKDIKG